MTLRFIHASDLHIGRKFANIPQPEDGNIRGRLMEARHGTIARLAEVAQSRDAGHVLLAGDTFDTATPSPAVIRQALAAMGQMRLDMADGGAQVSTPRRTAEIMIRHPNYSGLQRDQITQLFISAHFIDHLEVWQGDEMLFSLDGGISISEDPVFRFAYTENGAPTLKVIATDTEGNTFTRELPKLAEG